MTSSGAPNVAGRSNSQEATTDNDLLIDPLPELADDTPVERLRLSTCVHNALRDAGVKTVGEVREKSNADLLSFQNLGPGSVNHLRETLGLPSCDGVRPIGYSGSIVARR